MAIAKEQIRQIIADNNFAKSKWTYTNPDLITGKTNDYTIVKDEFELVGYYSDSFFDLNDVDLNNIENCLQESQKMIVFQHYQQYKNQYF